MTTEDFKCWLADHVGCNVEEMNRLLSSDFAVYFLIAWSLFEDKCFSKKMASAGIQPFAIRFIQGDFNADSIRCYANRFHLRYQNINLFKNLMHSWTDEKMNKILKRPFDVLTAEEIVYFSAFVVLRFRNNIFHGNKGVKSWLNYRDQIVDCTAMMQRFISHQAALNPVLSPCRSECAI